MKLLGTDIQRKVETEMTDALPRYYEDFKEVGNLVAVESAEFETLNAEIADVLAQFYVDTATWGLANWERICGLKTDEAKPTDQRRSMVKAVLRGMGTTTVAVVKNVAASFQNGEVEVIENAADYEVVIQFVGNRGTPPNINDVADALREIIPAHLGIRLAFTYLVWNELEQADFVWNTADTYRWNDLEKAKLV